MRHSTPDLEFCVRLYLGEVNGVNLDMFYDRIRHVRPATPAPCVYMNEILTMGGHFFTFDEQFLGKMLCDAGFRDISHAPYGESDVPELRGLEQHTRSPWMQQGTLVMECRKPG